MLAMAAPMFQQTSHAWECDTSDLLHNHAQSKLLTVQMPRVEHFLHNDNCNGSDITTARMQKTNVQNNHTSRRQYHLRKVKV